MKSFEELMMRQYPDKDEFTDDDMQTSYTEGIAEGRRLQLAEMRCKECKHAALFRPANSNEKFYGFCRRPREIQIGYISISEDFGCVFHQERRKE